MILQNSFQLVNISNIVSDILFHRIINAMLGFSRVFQVLATCKKVCTCKVCFLEGMYNLSCEKEESLCHYDVQKYAVS